MEAPVQYFISELFRRPANVVECDGEITGRNAAKTYHFHASLEVIIVRKGWADGLVGDIFGRMNEGSVIVLGSNISHKILGCSRDCRSMLIHIPLEILKWDDDRFPELAPGMDFLRASRCGMVYESPDLVRRLISLARKASRSDGFLMLSYLLQIIHILSRTLPDRTVVTNPGGVSGGGVRSALERAYVYLYEHYMEEGMSLDDVADAAGMEKSSLCRAFRRTYGTTVFSQLNKLRIEQACHLLVNTSENVTGIAWACGYNSFSRFSEMFRRQTGMCPSEYRANASHRNSSAL